MDSQERLTLLMEAAEKKIHELFPSAMERLVKDLQLAEYVPQWLLDAGYKVEIVDQYNIVLTRRVAKNVNTVVKVRFDENAWLLEWRYAIMHGQECGEISYDQFLEVLPNIQKAFRKIIRLTKHVAEHVELAYINTEKLAGNAEAALKKLCDGAQDYADAIPIFRVKRYRIRVMDYVPQYFAKNGYAVEDKYPWLTSMTREKTPGAIVTISFWSHADENVRYENRENQNSIEYIYIIKSGQTMARCSFVQDVENQEQAERAFEIFVAITKHMEEHVETPYVRTEEFSHAPQKEQKGIELKASKKQAYLTYLCAGAQTDLYMTVNMPHQLPKSSQSVPITCESALVDLLSGDFRERFEVESIDERVVKLTRCESDLEIIITIRLDGSEGRMDLAYRITYQQAVGSVEYKTYLTDAGDIPKALENFVAAKAYLEEKVESGIVTREKEK